MVERSCQLSLVASLKHLVRDSLAWGLERTGLSGPKPRALTIATFHRVLPAELRATYPFPGLAVTPEELDFFLSFFRARYTCGTLAQSWDRFRRGDRPERPLLAITFDDGQQDNVDHALPVLRRHDLKASFYLPSDLIDERRLIWHDRVGFELRAMGESPEAIEDRTEALKSLDPELRES